MKRTRATPPPSLDPRLLGFYDVIAELLVARELRLAESRRVVTDAVKRLSPAPKRQKK